MKTIFKTGCMVELIEVPPKSAIHPNFNAVVGHHYQILDIMGCCLSVRDLKTGESSILNCERFRPVPSAIVPVFS
ncbi:MAG: hypothetical protein AAB276_09355 [Pseudomonadota bacterium]